MATCTAVVCLSCRASFHQGEDRLPLCPDCLIDRIKASEPLSEAWQSVERAEDRAKAHRSAHCGNQWQRCQWTLAIETEIDGAWRNFLSALTTAA